VILINAVTETTSKGTAATPEYLWTVAETHGLDIPHVIDANKDFYKYANSTSISLPFNVVVDLRSMKIVKAAGGKATVSTIESLADQTLN
jgi:hypothetical protein